MPGFHTALGKAVSAAALAMKDGIHLFYQRSDGFTVRADQGIVI